jgi:O-acetyl-ADP-ribose deacetylase (regulator of RNase III)
MIVSEQRRDIFDSMAQTLVCPVNVVGTLGAGLAKQFRYRIPGLLEAYKHACWTKEFTRKGLWTFPFEGGDRLVLCFPTKMHWRNPSKLEWIDEGLFKLTQNYGSMGIQSIAMPALGCGWGELLWSDVQPMIYRHLGEIELPVEICLPPAKVLLEELAHQ